MKRNIFSFVYWSNISPGGNASREELHRIFWSSIVNMCTWSIGHVCKKWSIGHVCKKMAMCAKNLSIGHVCKKGNSFMCAKKLLSICRMVNWSLVTLSHDLFCFLSTCNGEPHNCPPQNCPLGGQSWGGQFWVHQSSELPTPTNIVFLYDLCFKWSLGECSVK